MNIIFTTKKRMSVDKLGSLYFSREHDLDKELFTPLASCSHEIRCMTGYFTSSVLSELAHSLICFLNHTEGNIQFIISPNLSEQDLVAINRSVEVDESFIHILFPDFELTEGALRYKALEALSYLIATKKLTLKIALQSDGMFHTKCWLFSLDEGVVAVHGSINATKSGIVRNFEQVAVNKSWESDNSRDVVDKIHATFQNIWEGNYEGLKTIPLNKACVNYLLQNYEGLEVSEDTQELLIKGLLDITASEKLLTNSVQCLTVPTWLNYTSGDFEHQGRAVDAWIDNGGQGILAIATGGGKTLTALVAASLIVAKEESLLIVIAVPTIALLNQWADDVKAFSVEPLKTQGEQLGQQVNSGLRRLRLKSTKCEVMIVTHESLKSEKMLRLLNKAQKSTPLMLIGDEVHNLGSIGFQNVAPDIFKYRLGLSATFKRQFDEEGTQFLLDYFGSVVFEFGLDEAIGVCLVPFDYFVHLVTLDEYEEEEWAELTFKIKKLSYAAELSNGSHEKELWQALCIKRRRIVESASAKVSVLASIFNKMELTRTLVFCTDKDPKQLNHVNALLNNKRINFHQITAEETVNKNKLTHLIESFDSGELNVLTSKRVLDEGFNIPQTEIAFLLASNTVKRQWVQRLGRVLRQSPKTKKQKAVIHDFVVMPSINNDRIDLDLKGLMKSELERIQFFDLLCKNGLEKNGTADVVEQLLELLES